MVIIAFINAPASCNGTPHEQDCWVTEYI